MSDRPTRSPRPRRRARRLVSAFLAIAVAAPIAAANPAGAQSAPLLTEDGVGIRVDETAVNGPVLEEVETATQPFVDDLIHDGAQDNPPISSYDSIEVSSNLELSADFLEPDAARPDGGLAVHADIADIEISYQANAWWHPACSIVINPDDATIDISASIDKSLLPGAPLAFDPVQATWDDDPAVSVTHWSCWGYLIDDYFSGWWNDFTGNGPESTASKIEAQLDDQAQDMLDDLWTDNVVPVLDSLDGFGVSINQVRTDDHGLIVTADVDATGGVTIPGLGGPFDVSGAEDSGADSDVNQLLANRTTDAGPAEIIASVHPNVANQFLYALDEVLNGNYGQPAVGAAIEELLVPPELRDALGDEDWSMRLGAGVAPHIEPTGVDGLPQLQFPEVTLEFRNGITTIATFEGTLTGLDLTTEARAGGTEWGPSFSSANADLSSVTRTFAHPLVEEWPAPSAAELLPYAADAFDAFVDSIFVSYVSLAPVSLGGIDIDLCPVSECGRYDGDERYTETFKVN